MYRSGDLARWRGRMAFWSLWVERTIRLRFAVFALSLGRSRLRCVGHASVSQAAVIARGDGPGGGQLVGYVVVAAGLFD